MSSLQLTHALVCSLAIGLAPLLAGCQTGPPEPKSAVRATPDHATQAREALERGDYGEAATLLREALVLYPNDLEAHYRLAVSASYLHLRNEAIREFQWVMVHGPADSPEVKAARDWLVLAGVLAERPTAAAAGLLSEESMLAALPDSASLSGKAMWGDDGFVKPMTRFQLFLKGVVNSPTEEQYYLLRTDQDGGFRFTGVVPGEYVLTDGVASQPTWRLRVLLRPGQSQILDLTPQNSTKIRDDFPDGRALPAPGAEPSAGVGSDRGEA